MCMTTSLHVSPDTPALKVIVFIFGPGSVMEDAERLIHAMQKISGDSSAL